MKLDIGRRVLIWIGRKGDKPLTYDDLVAAETRAFEAEERLAQIATVADGATQTGRYSRRLDARLQTIRDLAGPVGNSYPTEMSAEYLEGEALSRSTYTQSKAEVMKARAEAAQERAEVERLREAIRSALDEISGPYPPLSAYKGDVAPVHIDHFAGLESAASVLRAALDSTPQPVGGTTLEQRQAAISTASEQARTDTSGFLTPAGESGSPLLPQDRRRLEKWLRLLEQGELVRLDSLDLWAIRHICDAPVQAASPPSKGEDVERLKTELDHTRDWGEEHKRRYDDLLALVQGAISKFRQLHDEATTRWQTRPQQLERDRARGELRAFSSAAHHLKSNLPQNLKGDADG